MLIKQMVERYSPTGSEGELVEFLCEWADDRGFHSYKDEVGNFTAEIGNPEGKEILLLGHVDTVPGEIPVEIKNNKLYGRGAVDAKGPLGCFLEAVYSLSHENLKDKKLTIIGAVEEEGASKGARFIVDKYDPDYIIVGEPSGWSNLNIGYKGCLNVNYRNSKLKEHTSVSSPNCIEESISYFNEIKSFTSEFNEGKSLFNRLGTKLISIDSGTDLFWENVKMKLNFRIPPDYKIEKLRSFLENTSGEAAIEFSDFTESVKTDKNNRLISSFMKAIRAEDGKVKFKLKAGTSDMNLMQKFGVPVVTYGPGDSKLDHTPHEHLDLDEYEKSMVILKNVLCLL